LRRIALTFVMLLMGTCLIAGGAESIYPTALWPLDETIGIHSSVAAIALGMGICLSAVRPAAHIGWVRIGILYGPLVAAYQVLLFRLLEKPFSPGPLIFGLSCSVLLALLYPDRGRLIPPTSDAPERVPGLPV
jgi:hypothetical protein